MDEPLRLERERATAAALLGLATCTMKPFSDGNALTDRFSINDSSTPHEFTLPESRRLTC